MKLYHNYGEISTYLRQLLHIAAEHGFDAKDATLTIIYSEATDPTMLIAGWVHRTMMMISESDTSTSHIVFTMASKHEVARQSIPTNDDELCTWAGGFRHTTTGLKHLQGIDTAEINKIKDEVYQINISPGGVPWDNILASDDESSEEEGDEDDSDDEDD
ncbi:hypothetical protein QBC36DRAFT_289443 [Triangularia setosa]|uniref:Uncharacterized protein n=1 Tax=Triangularia setosa TaxID=2587417 RepID=A0AAN7A6W8_9PEZI|nr:hypothetical protein QBC36DRAFT_289443 [Podospora setosa]